MDIGLDFRVVPFYFPGCSDVWHEKLQSGPLGNFWLLPERIAIEYQGKTGTFTTTESAYQSLKWWHHDAIRKEFENAKDGQEAFELKLKYELDPKHRVPVVATWSNMKVDISENVNKWTGMLLVLDAKFAMEEMKQLLLNTGDAFLVERCPVRGRDNVWSDNGDGSGQNWLGKALMLKRNQLGGPQHHADALHDDNKWTQLIKQVGQRLQQVELELLGTIRWNGVGSSEVQLLGFENGILDLTAKVTDDFMATWALKSDDAKYMEAEQYREFKRVVRKLGGASMLVGGVTQNAIRIAQWANAGHRNFAGFIGFALGGDADGDTVVHQMTQAGVAACRYAVDAASDTTVVCALIPPNGDRALAFSEAAPSPQFCTEHVSEKASSVLQDEECMKMLQSARVMYSAGWFLLISPQLLMQAAKAHIERGGIFAFNLAGKPLMQYPTLSHVLEAASIAHYVLGNEGEFAAIATTMNLESYLDAAKAISKLGTPNKHVVITRGCDATVIVASDAAVHMEYPVVPIAAENIVDTIGAGDAFAGGFLSGLTLGKPLEQCVKAGHHAASLVIQNTGCFVPEDAIPPKWE